MNTIIIVRNPSFHGMFKMFICPTAEKAIYEEKLFRDAKVWIVGELVIYAYIYSDKAEAVRDSIYANYSSRNISIVNDWIYTSAQELNYYLRKVEERNSDDIKYELMEKPEKKPRKRK